MSYAAAARIDGLRLLDRTLITRIEQDEQAVQSRLANERPPYAWDSLRLYHEYGVELQMKIVRLTDLWSVLGGQAPRRGPDRWARNGNS